MILNLHHSVKTFVQHILKRNHPKDLFQTEIHVRGYQAKYSTYSCENSGHAINFVLLPLKTIS